MEERVCNKTKVEQFIQRVKRETREHPTGGPGLAAMEGSEYVGSHRFGVGICHDGFHIWLWVYFTW
jgi:hypothetical protein